MQIFLRITNKISGVIALRLSAIDIALQYIIIYIRAARQYP